MNAPEFLRELWTPTPPGLILLWTLHDKRSRYLDRPTGALLAPGEADVYTGVSLAHRDHGEHRRTPNALSRAIPGFWADIDVNGGPENKAGAAPTWDDAYALAESLAAPTLLVHSGYGLQAWWLFHGGPWRFADRGEQQQAAGAAAQWQALLRAKAGFGLDYTHDLARILRVPGTTNAKGRERKMVEVIEQGPRHARDELLQIASAAGKVDPGYSLADAPPVVVGAPTTAQSALARLSRSPAFIRTWNHERSDLPSMSEIDLALASMAALAGLGDQDIANVIHAHRALHDDPKATRLDYLQRTVARARLGREGASGETDAQHGRPAPPRATNSTRRGTYGPDSWARTIRVQLQAENRDTIPLPFGALTRALDGGTRPGDVVLVAGYTSHGKSILIDQMADTAAAAGKRVHLYLTEMTAFERGIRLLARRGIAFKKLRRRELNAADWLEIEAQLAKLPYGVSVVSDWSVEDVVAHIGENKWDQCYVDLIHGFDYRDERELSKTSSALVRAAKTPWSDQTGMSTSIVYTAHLNDGQMRDQRSARRPKPGLHSIKGSSSLKQDADLVIFVWQEDDDDGRPTGSGAVWVAKARQGALASVPVNLDTVRMIFTELGAERWAA